MKLEPYKPYLKLLITALLKIPPSSKTLYRGVKKGLLQLSEKFDDGETMIWWTVTSTAANVHVLENPQFMGNNGTPPPHLHLTLCTA